MTYTFTTKHGIIRSFNDHNSFCRAFENQARVEKLQELNKDIVYEESIYPEPVIESQLPLELELTTEEK